MKRKDPIDDLELYIDPTPLSKEEQINLSAFIRKLKASTKKSKANQGADNKSGLNLKSKSFASAKH